MATSNEIVPLSTSIAHMRSQYSIPDERQVHQQSKYRSWTPDNSEIPLNLNSNDTYG